MLQLNLLLSAPVVSVGIAGKMKTKEYCTRPHFCPGGNGNKAVISKCNALINHFSFFFGFYSLDPFAHSVSELAPVLK
jgi:hypothetical protein